MIYIVFAFNMGGVNIINIYAKNIFDSISAQGGQSSLSEQAQVSLVGLSNFIGAFVATFTVLYFTRRVLFIGGFCIIGFCMLLIAVLIPKKQPDLVLLSMSIAIIIFQCTIGSGIWVYASEIVVDSAMGVCVFGMFGLLAL
jgi:hypothetical protein